MDVTYVFWSIILAITLIIRGVYSAYKQIDCGPLYDPQNELARPYQTHVNWLNILGGVSYPNGSTTLGCLAEFRCEQGYFVHGNEYAVCRENGKWSIDSRGLFCDRIECIKPHFDIENGKVSTYLDYYARYKLDSLYWVTCDYGFKSNGTAVRVCLSNGTDTDKLYKGIWTQRDEFGKILEGGDTIPKCITDTDVVDCNVTDAKYINAVQTDYHNTEIIFLILFCLFCAFYVIEFIGVWLVCFKAHRQLRISHAVLPFVHFIIPFILKEFELKFYIFPALKSGNVKQNYSGDGPVSNGDDEDAHDTTRAKLVPPNAQTNGYTLEYKNVELSYDNDKLKGYAKSIKENVNNIDVCAHTIKCRNADIWGKLSMTLGEIKGIGESIDNCRIKDVINKLEDFILQENNTNIGSKLSMWIGEIKGILVKTVGTKGSEESEISSVLKKLEDFIHKEKTKTENNWENLKESIRVIRNYADLAELVGMDRSGEPQDESDRESYTLAAEYQCQCQNTNLITSD